MYTIDRVKIWKLVTIFFILIAIACVGFYGYVQRTPIIEKVIGQKLNADGTRIPNPGDTTKKELREYVASHDFVEGMNVVRVDFRQNVRATTYRDFKDAAIEDSWVDYMREHGPTVPLFGQNESANQRVVNLINGQFSCVPVLETSAGQLITAVKNYTTTICLVPIPPGYGDFIGFMNVFLKREPSAAEIKAIEKDVGSISLRMYERDIVKSQHHFGEILSKFQ